MISQSLQEFFQQNCGNKNSDCIVASRISPFTDDAVIPYLVIGYTNQKISYNSSKGIVTTQILHRGVGETFISSDYIRPDLLMYNICLQQSFRGCLALLSFSLDLILFFFSCGCFSVWVFVVSPG